MLIMPYYQFRFYDDHNDRFFWRPYQLRKYSIAVLRDHMDPFFNECRAYGRLIEKNVNGKVAVRCCGYLMLPADIEDELRERFGVTSWDRPDEEYLKPVSKREPLRAIVKDLVTEDVPLTVKTANKMLLELRKMLKFGIYNMDIQARNYKGGRLIDFSVAITTPHYWVDTLPVWRYKDTDLRDFDNMLDEAGVVTSNRAMPNQEVIRKLRLRDSKGRVRSRISVLKRG